MTKNDDAAEYVALISRQFALKQILHDHKAELMSLENEKQTNDSVLGQTYYEIHLACLKLDTLHQLHSFYNETVLLHIISCQAQQSWRVDDYTWSWINTDSTIWEDWHGLLAYVREEDTKMQLLNSWEKTGALDVSAAGQPNELPGFDYPVNLKRLSKETWEQIVAVILDEIEKQKKLLGGLGRSQAKLLDGNTTASKIERCLHIESIISSSEGEFRVNASKINTLKPRLGLPFDD